MDELWRTAPTPAVRIVLDAGDRRVELNAAAESWGQRAGIHAPTWQRWADLADNLVVVDSGPVPVSERMLTLPGLPGPLPCRLVRLADGCLLWLMGEAIQPPVQPPPSPPSQGPGFFDETRDMLSRALSLAGISLWQFDLERELIRFSEHGVRLLDRHRGQQDMRLGDVVDAIHPDDLAATRRSTEEALAGERVVDSVTRFRDEQVGWKHLLTRRVAQRDARGRATTLLGVALDVSELMQERELSLRLHGRMELAAETLGVGFWSHDTQTGEVEWDSRMYLLYGRAPHEGAPSLAEWLGRHVHPTDSVRMARRARARWDHRSPVAQETFRIVLPDGRERWIQGWTRRLLRDGHHVDFGLHMDVTERRVAELRTERERERDRFAIESAGIGVWERGFGDRPSYWSPTMYRLRGLSPADARPLADLVAMTVSSEDLADADLRMVRCIEFGETYRHEFEVCWPDGTRRWLASTGRAVRDAAGQAVALAGVTVDITERRLASAMARERDRAEQASAAKSGLMARVSHELRTPMNAVLGFADLMAQDELSPLEPRQAERLHQIRSAGGHLLGLIDDLLELSRAEAGGSPLERVPVVLDELIHEARQWVAALARQQGVWVHVPSAPLPGVVLADRRRLGQVMVNLLTNGIKYNQSGGHVRIRVDAAESDGLPAWVVCVGDDGRGLSGEQLSRLFEPFNRLGAEREGIPGTGIGLSIVQQLVQDMGGRLSVESEQGRGSEFRVSLPAANQAAAPLASPPEPAAEPSAARAGASGAPNKTLRVVYVEDNPVNELLVREMLSLRPYIQLKSAPDGRSGIAQVLAFRPDVVLLDLQLPDLSGIEVLHRLRGEPSMSASSFVALSANAMPDDVRHALEQGFDDYWTKPLDLLQFLAAMDALASRHGCDPAPPA